VKSALLIRSYPCEFILVDDFVSFNLLFLIRVTELLSSIAKLSLFLYLLSLVSCDKHGDNDDVDDVCHEDDWKISRSVNNNIRFKYLASALVLISLLSEDVSHVLRLILSRVGDDHMLEVIIFLSLVVNNNLLNFCSNRAWSCS
jgi:hypothetical protein